MTHYKMSDIAVEVNDRENNPASSKYDRFVGLEHYVSGEVIIRNYGSTENLESTMKIFQSGDVLVARRNVYLKRASMVDFDGLTSGDSIVLRAKNPVIGRILPFVLNTDAFWDFADQYSDGTMSKRLSPKTLMTYEFDLPDEDELEKFADLLWAANDARESYQALLRQTDELVKSQFIELFGDPELVLKSTHTVSEVADVQVGIVIKPTRFYADGVEGTKAFRSLNVGTMCVNDADWVYFSDDAMKETQRTVARTGDVLIVRSGNPGTSCVVTPEYDGCNVIDLIIAHPIKDKILPEYLCAFTNYPHGMNQIIGQQRGVAQKHFNVGLYNQMKIILPTLEEQRRFVAILKQTDKSKFVAYQETIFIEKILKYTYNHTFRRKNNVH